MENTNFIHNKGESYRALKNFTQLAQNHKVHFVTLLKDKNYVNNYRCLIDMKACCVSKWSNLTLKKKISPKLLW